ncbi:UDP-N-acetylmuramoyl-tripeptide--D-alanyl-D-alanine ligase [Pacificimonas sp. WHA3]|uniref:UDP-N-acetylmuramoyl-tripeptide--D-alanyl-D-alanine ligase n=1 Tax=Pacificimonas pallii TaxID=2827236 RepID=A0ABS6SFM7_9SPHN|nr:UDP-N-acetylmuramoyl-tripeptide--D-alanyl-D-alanine ligase [Pacificimonas pallii]MBV7257214.1 UDP-N-acetylmuramoyl-tripeptide--D-alanyl-D-alanine ligase [Pacificimonas pallii]
MTLWTSADIAAATGGTASADFTVDAVTFDSREVIGGELFVAMKGEVTDGHRFIGTAIDRGAAGCLVSAPVEAPHVLVKDGLAGLTALGIEARKRASAKIIGVTGSVGKTSVKEALRLALSEVEPLHTHASVKSYNNHTGVPLSLARMPADSRFGIFEMGMNHAGELSALTRLVRPDIAIITAIAPAHIEFFENEAAIADAKAEIFEGLTPGGTAILPLDSPHYVRLRARAERFADNVLTFGLDKRADVHVIRSAIVEHGTVVQAVVGDVEIAYTAQVAGEHWLSNAMATLAAAHAAGADIAAAALGIAQLQGLAGRGAQHEIPWGNGTVRLLDESYNANSASMKAALAVLADTATEGRRIAVLGAMKELGDRSDEYHAELAAPIRAAGADPVILVGEEMQPLAAELGCALLPNATAAEEWLRSELKAGDTVLVKGSNSIGLSRIISAFRGEAA